MIRNYLKKSVNAIKRNFFQFLLVVILFSVLTMGIMYIFMPSLIEMQTLETQEEIEAFFEANNMTDQLSTIILGYVFLIFVSTSMSLGITKMSQEALNGKTSWKSMIPIIKQKFITNIVAAFALIAIILTSLLSVGIGIWVLTSSLTSGLALAGSGILYAIWLIFIMHFSLYTYAIVIDNLGSIASLKKSYNIVRKNFLQFLRLISAILIFVIIMSLVLTTIEIDILGLDGSITNMLIQMITTVLFSIIFVLFYLDHRKSKKQPIKKYTQLRRISRKTIRNKNKTVKRKKKTTKRKKTSRKRKTRRR
jgi:hypothetical protein